MYRLGCILHLTNQKTVHESAANQEQPTYPYLAQGTPYTLSHFGEDYLPGTGDTVNEIYLVM